MSNIKPSVIGTIEEISRFNIVKRVGKSVLFLTNLSGYYFFDKFPSSVYTPSIFGFKREADNNYTITEYDNNNITTSKGIAYDRISNTGQVYVKRDTPLLVKIYGPSFNTVYPAVSVDIKTNKVETIKVDNFAQLLVQDFFDINFDLNNVFLLPTVYCVDAQEEPAILAKGAFNIINFICVNNKDDILCAGDKIFQKVGFTNLNECRLNKVFTYCLENQKCGDGNCKGPCDKGNVCMENGMGIFECVPENQAGIPISPGTGGSTGGSTGGTGTTNESGATGGSTGGYTGGTTGGNDNHVASSPNRTKYIIAASVIGLIILIIIIVLVIVMAKKKSSK